MRNKLSMTWGVVPGRQVGKVTKRFHKKRAGNEAEQVVAKLHGITLSEARRKLRYARQYHASQTLEMRAADALECTRQRIEAESRAEAKAKRENAARDQRVADYLASL